MTVRDKAIQTMMRERYGSVLDSVPGYAVMVEPMGQEYERLIRSIDWNRVLIVAAGRHRFLHDENDNLAMRDVCGECVMAALLARDRVPDWIALGIEDTE